jgi:hypothetical protein
VPGLPEPGWTRLAGGCHPEPVTPSADLSRPRRPIFFPVVIATVFLTIIGMTAGFVLGERHRRTVNASTETPQTSATYAPTESTSAPSGPLCPEATRATAVKLGFSSDLRQVFRIVTDHDNVVWICADPDGNLYYQGKNGGVRTKMVEGKNALFLSQVIKQGEDEYQVIAPADRTRFEINRKQLIIYHANGRKEVQDVVED